MRMICRSCGGTFLDVQSDGLPYFHACAPVTLAEVKDGKKLILVPLTELNDSDVAAPRVQLERTNKRDENIHDAGEHRGQIKSEGDGIEPAPPVEIEEPAAEDAIAPFL